MLRYGLIYDAKNTRMKKFKTVAAAILHYETLMPSFYYSINLNKACKLYVESVTVRA